MTDMPSEMPDDQPDEMPIEPDEGAPAQPGEDPGSLDDDDVMAGGSDTGGEAPI